MAIWTRPGWICMFKTSDGLLFGRSFLWEEIHAADGSILAGAKAYNEKKAGDMRIEKGEKIYIGRINEVTFAYKQTAGGSVKLYRVKL